MRISDWSSDVCSSDLPRNAPSARNGGWFRHCRTGQWRPLRYFPASHRLNRTKGEDEGASYAHLCGQAVDKARNSMAPDTRPDRKSVVRGKSVSVRVVLGGRGVIKQKNKLRSTYGRKRDKDK